MRGRQHKNVERRAPAAPAIAGGPSTLPRDYRAVAKQVAAFKAAMEAAGFEVVVVTREQWEARDK